MTTKDAVTKTVELAWADVARSLFASQGIRSGLWHLAVKVNFAATTAMVEPGMPKGGPICIVGMEGLALIAAPGPGMMVFDAAALSPSSRPLKAPAKAAAAESGRSKKPLAKKATAKVAH